MPAPLSPVQFSHVESLRVWCRELVRSRGVQYTTVLPFEARRRSSVPSFRPTSQLSSLRSLYCVKRLFRVTAATSAVNSSSGGAESQTATLIARSRSAMPPSNFPAPARVDICLAGVLCCAALEKQKRNCKLSQTSTLGTYLINGPVEVWRCPSALAMRRLQRRCEALLPFAESRVSIYPSCLFCNLRRCSTQRRC